MYLTYSEYQSMGGALDETTFTDLEMTAQNTIDWYTFNRLSKETEYSDKVKHLMFRLIEIEYIRRQALSLGQDSSGNDAVSIKGAIASQSNDGYSTSFNSLSASNAIDVTKSEMDNIVKMYLQGEVNSLGHRLLYRGIYPDE